MDKFWWLFQFVPPWVWFVFVFVTSGVVYFYLSPIINVIWAITPKWLKIALGAVASLIGAVIYGRYQGAKTEREIQKQRDVKAVETRKKVDESVHNATDAELDKRADRWMRD